ncbi:hypothetical protein CCP3SC15_770008 [Gammaproteobacteria bacterium]
MGVFIGVKEDANDENVAKFYRNCRTEPQFYLMPAFVGKLTKMIPSVIGYPPVF